eukprot:3663360-Alexandrium_andersonii.AAC.1
MSQHARFTNPTGPAIRIARPRCTDMPQDAPRQPHDCKHQCVRFTTPSTHDARPSNNNARHTRLQHAARNLTVTTWLK